MVDWVGRGLLISLAGWLVLLIELVDWLVDGVVAWLADWVGGLGGWWGGWIVSCRGR